jgi:glucose/arabinose dehydrogenase
MRRLIPLLVAGVVAAGCSDAPSADTAPPAAPVTVTTSTTQAPVATTGPSDTTSSTVTTTAPTTTVGSLEDLSLTLTEFATGFSQPVLMVPAPDGRLFVVDQPGVLWVIDGGDPQVFLDLSAEVRFNNEQGLLGLAFHPDFGNNGLLYIYYIDNSGNSVVESIVADGNAAGARHEILGFDQPAANHNGGMMEFGPDGNLWIGTGDGGGSNNQFGNAQRSDTPLGAMLRITVGPQIDTYEVPPGNLQDMVWAVGLRNPWRWTFDGNDLWIADVGQATIEEVDVVDWRDGNPNFGWSILEGSQCFQADTCDRSGLIEPIYEYTHADGCAITGGFVYRGDAIPELAGQYLFSDYCTGWLRSVDREGTVHEWLPTGTLSGVTGFGVDAAGEEYLTTSGGTIYAIVRGA